MALKTIHAGCPSFRGINISTFQSINLVMTYTVKAPNIAHLSLLTSIVYNKKETKLNKKCHKHVTNAPKGIGLA